MDEPVYVHWTYGFDPVERLGVFPSDPVPTELIAATVKLYDVLSDRPVL